MDAEQPLCIRLFHAHAFFLCLLFSVSFCLCLPLSYIGPNLITCAIIKSTEPTPSQMRNSFHINFIHLS